MGDKFIIEEGQEEEVCQECGEVGGEHSRGCFYRLRLILGKAKRRTEVGPVSKTRREVAVLEIEDYNELVAVLGGAE